MIRPAAGCSHVDAGEKECCECLQQPFVVELRRHLAYERSNIKRVLILVDETARIYKVEAIGTLGQKILAIANQLQIRAERAEGKVAELEKAEMDRCHALALAWDGAHEAFQRES